MVVITIQGVFSRRVNNLPGCLPGYAYPSVYPGMANVAQVGTRV